MSYTIRKALPAEADIIHHIGNAAYYATYSDILSREQIVFMLNRSYTPDAIRDTMSGGQDFYLLWEGEEAVGFIAIQVKDKCLLRIEKLYLLASCQGKGYGAALIQFAAEEARKRRVDTLELNVNRGNKAYYFYLKQGFEVVQEIDIPYFGFILDDYVMQKKV
ncbi:GNAT family N-acetyltransferase [Sphingobacterium wenxiniae]|uniref:Ribosomal protein S18 acetylase RimI n=1 Tax=Sphingobacterium wenxiniae TaxID=683125 RepID=A0A1I6S9E7_9SPHI|nr:GNAT family N-acetyltransferase [Sphingobacterium wenxiniae]SFS73605.1 Ribosomal protein S18 acetylase RimI [Sphingobacterium wenxiniae]